MKEVKLYMHFGQWREELEYYAKIFRFSLKSKGTKSK